MPSAGDTKLWAERSQQPGLRAVLDPADRFGVKNGYIDYCQKRLLERVLAGRPRFQHTLDFGCGVGRMSEWLLRTRSLRVTGYDRDPGMLEQARSSVPGAEFAADPACVPKDVDALFTLWVLQHILSNEELDQTLRPLLSRARFVVIYEKTADVAHEDRTRADGPLYQRVRTVAEYVDVFRGLGFSPARIEHSLIRQYGPMMRHAIPLLRSPDAARLYPVLFAIDDPLSKVLARRAGAVRERDTCMLMVRA